MILGLLLGVLGGFVLGVLFGRRNKNKVEVALAEANALLAKAGIKK